MGRGGDDGLLLLAGRRFGGRHLVRGVRERRFQLDVLGVGGRGLLARAALGPEAVQREVAQDHGDGGGDDEADDEADARRGRAGRASRALLAEDVDRARVFLIGDRYFAVVVVFVIPSPDQEVLPSIATDSPKWSFHPLIPTVDCPASVAVSWATWP